MKAVQGYGEIVEEYGGYAIRIIDGARFPWSKVCTLLLGADHEVWIEKRNGDLYIITKPITD
ncbi:MAG: hypothetical protein RMJ28_02070 [Nitrososphaerota archaeon]|nr:hypothetical protein [Candidatus Calditenuaceae archaeon]MDW8073010.1 hypothetical protein [Nitrososphaerota archaeon]